MKQQTYCQLDCSKINGVYSGGNQRRAYLKSLANNEGTCCFENCTNFPFVLLYLKHEKNKKMIGLCPGHAHQCTTGKYKNVVAETQGQTANIYYISNSNWKEDVGNPAYNVSLKKLRSTLNSTRGHTMTSDLGVVSEHDENASQPSFSFSDDDDDSSIPSDVIGALAVATRNQTQASDKSNKGDGEGQGDTSDEDAGEDRGDTSSQVEEDGDGGGKVNGGGNGNGKSGGNDNGNGNDKRVDEKDGARHDRIEIIVTVKKSRDGSDYCKEQFHDETTIETARKAVEEKAGTRVVLCQNRHSTPLSETTRLLHLKKNNPGTDLVLFASFVEWSEILNVTRSLNEEWNGLMAKLQVAYPVLNSSRLEQLVGKLAQGLARLLNMSMDTFEFADHESESESDTIVNFNFHYLVYFIVNKINMLDTIDSTAPGMVLGSMIKIIQGIMSDHCADAFNSQMEDSTTTTNQNTNVRPKKDRNTTTTTVASAVQSRGMKKGEQVTDNKASGNNTSKKQSKKEAQSQPKLQDNADELEYICDHCGGKFVPAFPQVVCVLDGREIKSSSFPLLRCSTKIDGAALSWLRHEHAVYAHPFGNCKQMTTWPDKLSFTKKTRFSSEEFGMALQAMPMTTFITTYLLPFDLATYKHSFLQLVNSFKRLEDNAKSVEVQSMFYRIFGDLAEDKVKTKSNESWTNRKGITFPPLQKDPLNVLLGQWTQDIQIAVRYVLLAMTCATLPPINFEVTFAGKSDNFRALAVVNEDDEEEKDLDDENKGLDDGDEGLDSIRIVLDKDLDANIKIMVDLLMKILFEATNTRLKEVITNSAIEQSMHKDILKGAKKMELHFRTKARTMATLIHYHFRDVKKFVMSPEGMNLQLHGEEKPKKDGDTATS